MKDCSRDDQHQSLQRMHLQTKLKPNFNFQSIDQQRHSLRWKATQNDQWISTKRFNGFSLI